MVPQLESLDAKYANEYVCMEMNMQMSMYVCMRLECLDATYSRVKSVITDGDNCVEFRYGFFGYAYCWNMTSCRLLPLETDSKLVISFD